ncbi:MAG: ATP-binding protein [Rhodothermales bacterium]
MLEIAQEDIDARLAFDNPWWDSPEDVIPFEKNVRRKYFEPFFRALNDRSVRRAIVLMGPRRVGKTVMVYQAIADLIRAGTSPQTVMYASLETPIYTGIALDKLVELFAKRFEHSRHDELTIFFDEIQYLRDWETHLKSLVDSFPAYKFVVTGSAAAALRLKSNESGAGRFTDYILPPLTFAEYLMFVGREDELLEKMDEDDGDGIARPSYRATNISELNEEFVNYLNFGGYPEAVFSDLVRSNASQYIKSDIIDKVLLRDLPSLYGINDIQELNRLFTTLAYNTGQEISLESLAQSSGVAKNTIKRYMEYLEAAFLIRRVERIDQNAKRFKRAMNFKVYLSNPSMRAALFGTLSTGSPEIGALTETAIFSQWQHNQATQLFYARWKSGEVDIVHLDRISQKPTWIVEVKWSDQPATKTQLLDNCVRFASRFPKLRQPILMTTKSVSSIIDYHNTRFRFRPSSEYAYALGANILNSLDLLWKGADD